MIFKSNYVNHWKWCRNELRIFDLAESPLINCFTDLLENIYQIQIVFDQINMP